MLVLQSGLGSWDTSYGKQGRLVAFFFPEHFRFFCIHFCSFRSFLLALTLCIDYDFYYQLLLLIYFTVQPMCVCVSLASMAWLNQKTEEGITCCHSKGTSSDYRSSSHAVFRYPLSCWD